jgi:hypothetical protein
MPDKLIIENEIKAGPESPRPNCSALEHLGPIYTEKNNDIFIF